MPRRSSQSPPTDPPAAPPHRPHYHPVPRALRGPPRVRLRARRGGERPALLRPSTAPTPPTPRDRRLPVEWDRLTGPTWLGMDTATAFAPWYTFLGQQLRAGHIPVWNPNQFSGAPFAAQYSEEVTFC